MIPIVMKLQKYSAFALIMYSLSPVNANAQSAAEERFRPNSAAHGIHWDYSLVAPYHGAGLRATYAFNSWFAYGFGGRTLFRLQDDPGVSTRYLISVMPVSQFIFRYPVLMNHFWRPYFVSELNYLYQFSDGRETAGISGRSGIEFFVSQNFSLAFEAGLQLPFYRNTNATLPQGGILSVVGAWYF